MNIKLSAEEVRFRVTSEELQRLMTGGNLILLVPLPPSHIFRVSVRAVALGSWQFESDPTGLWLTIPQSELQELAAKLPSKEGLSCDFETGNGRVVKTWFEVDVRRKAG